jgi:hypothetical protein
VSGSPVPRHFKTLIDLFIGFVILFAAYAISH